MKTLTFRYSIVLTLFLIPQFLLSQKWEPLHRLTSQEYNLTLDYWAGKYPDIFKVEKIGKSEGQEDISLLKITDPAVPDNKKQVILITSLHGGPERTGTTTILHFAEWLLSNDKEAKETRQKQVALLIPIILPVSYFETDAYFNSNNICPYTGEDWTHGVSNWDFNTLTYKKADEAPEVMAFINVVDQYKPDVHMDLHGIGVYAQSEQEKQYHEHQMYKGHMMFDVSTMSYSNSVLRPWDWRITEAMVGAGKEAGFPSDRAEADAQRLHWIPGLNNLLYGKIWAGRPRFYTALYAYFRYHTLLVAPEVGWEESGVARTKGLIRIGNKIWDGEKTPGYPVNKVHAFVGKYVTSWGQDAGELRKSRVELWQKQINFSAGILYPETDGEESFVVGLTEAGNKMMNKDLDVFIKNLRGNQEINADEIEDFIKNGKIPRMMLHFQNSSVTEGKEQEIVNGIGFRIRIPYKNAEIQNVRLNGHLLAPGAEDGYESWVGDGYLQLQINVPPQKSPQMDIAVITCQYQTKTKRSYGWIPPKEVMEKLAN